ISFFIQFVIKLSHVIKFDLNHNKCPIETSNSFPYYITLNQEVQNEGGWIVMSFKNINQSIQTFGRTLLLPIGVLAPIGMILGISGALTQDYMVEKVPFLGNKSVNDILESILTISNVIFVNIPLLFALGVAYGMSKKDKGIAVFASVTGYLCLIVSMNVYLVLTGTIADA